jgi:superfamily II DNA or RNA helicase
MHTMLPGTEVVARGLHWEIVLSQNLGAHTLYRLRGVNGILKGQELDLLHPFEEISPVPRELAPEKAAPLTNWLVYNQAFLLEQALGSSALLAAQPGRLQIQPYQLVPVLRAIRSSRVRLLLADAVGLGKTIQAGLIITELMARRLAHRILIVSPAGPLLDQWNGEMRERFSLRLDVLDRARMEEIRRSTEIGANPFDSVALGLASIDFLKQERVLEQLERTSYDAIIIDEAHHCFDLGAAQEKEDSLRRRLAAVLARRCDALVLLTATPHDGNDRSFASLCELLDPSLVDVRGNLVGERFRQHVVRRLKGHIRDPRTGQPLFRNREVTPCAVMPDATEHAPYVSMMKELRGLIAPELRRAFRARRYNDVLSFIALLKRSVSTVAACRSTLSVVADRLRERLAGAEEDQQTRQQRLRTLRDYYRRLERFGTTTAEEEQDRQLLEAEDLAERLADLEHEVRSGGSRLGHERRTSVVEALDAIARLADRALTCDPKLAAIVAEVGKIRAAEPDANVLIYTEYVTSQEAAAVALRSVGAVLTMSGEDDEKTRANVTAKFRTQRGLVLVSTDAAAEGLNLHQRCHHLIHLELPFNPNRLEQRNGRIDRYGQQETPIVLYLYIRSSFEERILLRLIAKYERQRARLNFMPNTLGLTTSTDAGVERLLSGIMSEDSLPLEYQGPQFEFFTGDENEGADDSTREILEAEDRVLRGFVDATAAKPWLGDGGIAAEPENLREANSALVSGERVSSVNLAAFVRDAVLLDHGDIQGAVSDPVFTLVLPHSWCTGLDGYPGYDAQSRQFRLTTSIDVLSDSGERPVGFIGRGHPLVRMALDRVRNLSFGGAAQRNQDIRVSAVSAPVAQPALLYTFVGRVISDAGREFERVLAVMVTQKGEPQVFETAEDWMRYTSGRPLVTRDLWKKHFISWGATRAGSARTAAEGAFQGVVDTFITERTASLRNELEYQQSWLADRAREIAIEETPTIEQQGLFTGAQATAPRPTRSTWASLSDPLERLDGFSRDLSQPVTKRSEAEASLAVYRERSAELKRRLELRAPEVAQIGLLMLLPEGVDA